MIEYLLDFGHYVIGSVGQFSAVDDWNKERSICQELKSLSEYDA